MTRLIELITPINRNSSLRTLKKGTTFHFKDEIAAIMQGLVAAEAHDSFISQIPVTAVYGPGDVLNLGALSDYTRPRLQYYAEEDTLINVVSRDYLMSCIDKLPDQAYKEVIQDIIDLGQLFTASLEETLGMAFHPCEDRLVWALRRVVIKLHGTREIPLPLFRISSHAAISDTSTSRRLKDLEEKGIVKKARYGKVELL